MMKLNVYARGVLNFFFNRKIKTKFLVSYIFIILLITFVIGGSTLYISTTVIKKNTQELDMQLISQMSLNITYRANELEKLTFNLISDSNFTGTMFGGLADHAGNQNTIKYRTINNVISQYTSFNNLIHSVDILTNEGILLRWGSEVSPSGKSDTRDFREYMKKVKERLSRTDNGTVWLSSPYTKDEIVFAREIIDQNSLKKFGIIVFSINNRYFRLLKEDNSVIKEENLIILNKYNEILIGQKSAEIGNIADIITKDIDSYKAKSGKNVSCENRQYLFSMVESDNLKWKILCLIPTDDLLKNADILKVIIFLACLFSIVIAVGIAYVISSGTTKNIKRLENSIKTVEEGDLTVKVKPASMDEIGQLGLRFNYMIDRINELINTVYKERIAKQQAEFQVLQSQINPHFLYNTLGSMKWLARMKKQPDIEAMTSSLIELLKSAVSSKDEFISIKEEIRYVENYLILQRYKFGDSFKADFHVDESISGYKILRFILQPLVENSLYHGLEISKGSGRISIRALKVESRIVLEVEDNGVGMSEERIREVLFSQKEKIYPGLSSIGVKNVNERIKLYYGNEFGLTFHSRLEQGTRVEIVLPYQNGKIGEDEIDAGNAG